MSNFTYRLPLLTLALFFAACSSDATLDGGSPGDDTGTPDSGVIESDTGVVDTGLPPDSGVPLPCQRDQGGAANRGCDPGQVCNLAMDPPVCVAGRACDTDNDCNDCSRFQNPADCGHGYHLTAWCDPNHQAPGSAMAGTCTRSLSPCEPCEVDADCGHQDSIVGGAQNKCLSYDDGSKACGRPCGCPDGFACDVSGQCKRAGDSCGGEPVICPAATANTQIARNEVCPDTGGARCATNDVPGALGICIGICVNDSDCPANLPVCNRSNGICISGCTAGSCPQGQVCHSDGFCNPPCVDDQSCTDDPKYGTSTYCNQRGRPEPKIYKDYRDLNACAPLGCERKVDCPAAGIVCDKTETIPECKQGCYERDDCLSGLLCKSGAQGSYNREACRALPTKTDAAEIGVCCNPGCLDRTLACAIGEYCCAEEDSPYEDPGSCGTFTSSTGGGSRQAQPGECFPMPSPTPWCAPCDGTPGECNSGWTFGYNIDPAVNGGQPFQEQEGCVTIDPMAGINVCKVTCNPTAADSGCPGRWPCAPDRYSCLQDADCGGLECINEDTTANPPRPGQCKCGENGVAQVACPDTVPNSPLIEHPRCVEVGTNMICISGYTCSPANNLNTYPQGCGF